MLSRITALAVSVAAIAVVLLIAAQPQVVAQSGPYTRAAGSGFAVHPRDMVNIRGSLPLPPFGEAVVYTVPTDRWLVIVPHADDGGVGLPLSELALVERFNGNETEKAQGDTYGTQRYTGPSSADGLGWAFKPGSEVVIRTGSNSGTSAHWNLFGYLTPL